MNIISIPKDMETHTLFIEIVDESVRSKYESIQSHAGDAGVDLYVPTDTVVPDAKSVFVGHGIKCKMITRDGTPCSYYLYPRSSIAKTPLMMSNHVGIIDAGYRGEIIGAFRNLGSEPYTIAQSTRLVQICAPTLSPIIVKVLPEGEHLDSTTRGSGGFGSTGK